jgi:hypothetical protein
VSPINASPFPGGKIEADSWAVKVMSAALRHLGKDHHVTVVEVRLLGPHELAILFLPVGVGAAWTGPPCGVRLSSTTPIADEIVARGRDYRAGDASPEELAFDLANLIIGEPFGDGSLSRPDAQGVRWRRLDAF